MNVIDYKRSNVYNGSFESISHDYFQGRGWFALSDQIFQWLNKFYLKIIDVFSGFPRILMNF